MNSSMIAPWEDFGFKVQMLIEHPKNAGTISQKEAEDLNAKLFVHQYGSQEIGESVTLYWAVDDDDNILLSRFTAFGAPSSIASHEMVALLCRNKSVEQASEIAFKGLEYFLRDNPSTPAFPESDNYSVSIALDAIRRASMEYYKDEALSSEDESIVATDSPMSLRAIQESIKLHDIKDIEGITNYTKAGRYDKQSIEASTFGGSRINYLSDILKNTQEELQAQKQNKQMDIDMPFKQMDQESQIVTINKAIDDSGVRQYLIMDGGDMEILDVKINGEDIDIYIRYLGACSGCASSTTGTLFAIETTLKEKIDENIRVLPI